MDPYPQILTPEQALAINPAREPLPPARARREKRPTYGWRFWLVYGVAVATLAFAAGAAVAKHLLTAGA